MVRGSKLRIDEAIVPQPWLSGRHEEREVKRKSAKLNGLLELLYCRTCTERRVLPCYIARLRTVMKQTFWMRPSSVKLELWRIAGGRAEPRRY